MDTYQSQVESIELYHNIMIIWPKTYATEEKVEVASGGSAGSDTLTLLVQRYFSLCATVQFWQDNRQSTNTSP